MKSKDERRAELFALDERRKAAGFDWAAVCRASAVPYTTVFRCLKRGQAPNLSTLESIRAALEELVNQRRANLERL